jgi:hypothetical protein
MTWILVLILSALKTKKNALETSTQVPQASHLLDASADWGLVTPSLVSLTILSYSLLCLEMFRSNRWQMFHETANLAGPGGYLWTALWPQDLLFLTSKEAVWAPQRPDLWKPARDVFKVYSRNNFLSSHNFLQSLGLSLLKNNYYK